jgi:ATP-dependent RNA helicase SUPV3L1/SUV3
MVGYRVCGNRAIRVDILERLADLIRPALSWRPGAPGEKPAGAFDGRGFTVTVGMTSLAGCSGEDFASILRSLGYRLDRRPPLPAQAPAAASVPVVADVGTPAGTVAAPTAVSTDEIAPALAPDAPAESVDPAPPAEVASDEAAPIELGLGGIDASVTVAPAEQTAAAEPVFVDVWRPGRPEGARRPARRPKQPRREQRAPRPIDATAPQPADTPASADTAAAAGGEPREHRERPDRRDGPRRKQRRFDGIRAEQPVERNDGERKPRSDRPRHDRPRPDRPRPERPRDKPVDPNSPFAALLELKARLEADQKEKG